MPWLDSLLQVYGSQIALLILGVGAIWQFWPAIQAALMKGIGGIKIGTPEVPLTDNQKDFAALERLQERFRKNGCKEGEIAIQTCLQHFFHSEDSH